MCIVSVNWSNTTAHSFSYVWFDVETTQNTPVTDPPGTVERPIYKHEVNVLISHHMCVPCIDAGIDIDAKQRAPGCVCGRGKRRRHYVSWKANGSGQDPVGAFIDTLLHRSPKQARLFRHCTRA